MRRQRRPERDPFAVLGVPREADDATIKRAYRKLAAAYHPDRNPDPHATEKLKEVIAAWELLSDPNQRRRYEEFQSDPPAGSADEEPSSVQPHVQPAPRPRPRRRAPSARRQPPRNRSELAAFEALFREFLMRDADSATDVVLGWLGASACLLALMFYAFQGAVAPFFVEVESQAAFAGRSFENGPAEPALTSAPGPRVVDYADPRFWSWMAVGACFALTPGLTAKAMVNTLSLLIFWRRRGNCWWWSLADVPDDLRTGIRGCGVFIIWVVPNAWPTLIWT